MSSVVEGFADYRAAARTGIEAAGATPVLVNEDLPSQTTSSRNACLDAIDSADCLLSIVGKRAGWTAPSGFLVVEEEFDHARIRSIPVFAFLQDTPRDADADRFVRKLSDYVDGMFRTKFQTPAELQSQVERAIRGKVEAMNPRSVDGRNLASFLAPGRQGSGDETMLRFVLAPERQEEVIDPVRIASEAFKEQLLELGHARSARLFDYSRGKSAEIKGAALVIEQDRTNNRHGTDARVRLEFSELGLLVLDGNVTGRSGDSIADAMRDSFVIDLQNVEDALTSFFRFSAALYEEIDRHRRHERFYYNVGLRGLGYRSLERDRKPKESYGMSTHKSDAIAAFPTSRVLSRAALAGDPRDEIQRVIALLERSARE